MPGSLKFIVRLFVGLGVIAVAFVAALLLVVLNVDPNQYKEEIVAVAERKTGYKVNIEGGIKLDLFPVASLDVARISIDNPAPFEGNLVFVERASAQLKLGPLLRKRLEIGKIVLSKPQITLLVAPDGHNNWEGNLSTGGAPSGAPGEPPFDLMALLSGLSLAGVSVSDASVVWRDEYAREHVRMDRLNLETGAIASGKPTDFSLRGSLLDRYRGFSADANIDGTITIDPLLQQVNMENFDATGSFRRGDDPAVDARLVADAVFELKQDRLLLKRANAVLGDARIDMDGSVAGLFSSRRSMELKVAGNTLNLHDLARILEIRLPLTRDNRAFQSFAVSGDFAAVLGEGQATATIRRATVTLDDSRVQLQGDVAWAPALQMTLSGELDRLDAARYLPPKDEAAVSAGPLEFPINDLHAEAVFRNGRLRVSRLAAMVFGGKIDGEAWIETGETGGKGVPMKWSTRGKAGGVDLARVAAAFLPENAWSPRGTGDLSWQLRASGDDAQTLTRSLGGVARLSLVDGGLRDPKLAANIERIVALLEKRSRRDSGEEVVLHRVDASFDLKGGIAENRDLQVDMPLLRAQGAGDIDFVSSSIDYRIRAGLCPEACKSGREQPDLPFAVRLGGPFDDIEYSLDLRSVVRQAARMAAEEERVKEVLEKKKEELLEKKDRTVDAIKDKLREGIGSILGGKKLPF